MNTEFGMKRLTRCRGCYAPAEAFDEILRLDPMPLVGDFSSSPGEARSLVRYPFTVIYCGKCGLVQVLEDVDADILFGTYHYKSSSISGVVRHFEGYAHELSRRYGDTSVSVLEVGCNDGVLLNRLPTGWRRVGVDPSDVAAQAANGSYELVNSHFTSALSTEIAADGLFDLVVSSNCVAHVSDIRDTLLGMSRVIRDGGDLWLEAHDLDAVLRGQWDALYHEHKAYWSVDSLARCAALHGFQLQEVAKLSTHGGLLRVRFRKMSAVVDTDAGPVRPVFDRLLSTYAGRRSSAVYKTVEQLLKTGARVASYGASGRAAVWFNQLPELEFAYVVDDSPLRANTWIPGVGLPVVEAEVFKAQPPDACVITAWNYADDIRQRHQWFGGTWLQNFTSQGSEPD